MTRKKPMHRLLHCQMENGSIKQAIWVDMIEMTR